MVQAPTWASGKGSDRLDSLIAIAGPLFMFLGGLGFGIQGGWIDFVKQQDSSLRLTSPAICSKVTSWGVSIPWVFGSN